ncbi:MULTISPECIES: hypothetical protein [unclassified Streptomyces]|uniref:hypothetical protein n=1 Tax=unclassified Streptomyces TaxID=2593676 RepID=UPI0036E0AEC5
MREIEAFLVAGGSAFRTGHQPGATVHRSSRVVRLTPEGTRLYAGLRPAYIGRVFPAGARAFVAE